MVLPLKKKKYTLGCPTALDHDVYRLHSVGLHWPSTLYQPSHEAVEELKFPTGYNQVGFGLCWTSSHQLFFYFLLLFLLFLHTFTHTHAHTHTHARPHAHTHTHTRTHARTHTHTRTLIQGFENVYSSSLLWGMEDSKQ